MRVADENDLFGDTWLVYDFIARNFIGSLSQNLKYMSTHVVLQIGGEKFECKGKLSRKRWTERDAFLLIVLLYHLLRLPSRFAWVYLGNALVS